VDFVARHVRGLPRSGIREFFDLVQGQPDVISLGVGEPDFVTPWHIREAAIYALERGRTSYTSNLGLLKLREAIARTVQRRFGVSYDPRREVLVTVGVSEAHGLALRVEQRAIGGGLDDGQRVAARRGRVVVVVGGAVVSQGPRGAR
jgi:aminotransferase